MSEIQNNSNKYLPLLLGICTAVGMVVGLNIPRYDKSVAVYPNRPSGGGSSSLLGEVLGYLDAKYVDDVDSIGFDEDAIKGLLAKLDPHTTYLSPAAVEQADEEMSGSFKGIGIEFLMHNDTLQIITPIAGGPAEAAGIWSGDQLIKVNDTLIAGVKVTDEQLFKMLRGEEGTTVQISLRRGNEPGLKTVTVTRAEIPVHCVTSAYLLDENTAYLKLTRFNQNTHQEFLDALIPMVEKRTTPLDLVLDLRGNPGGLLDQAVQVLSDFFPEDKLLVYTEGRSEKKHEYKSSGRAQINLNRLAVLLDEGSASASEVVAGAIQDHDRGWIVGERSFGKGLVQEQYNLSNGGALRVTVSRYYTPSGRCIQKDFTNRKAYSDEHLHRSDSTQFVDSTVYYTGRGRKVYSNMGISPDFVVRESDIEKSAQFGRARSLMSSFIAKWMEGRQKSNFPAEANEFSKNYSLEADTWAKFQAHAAKQGLTLSTAEWAKLEPLAKNEIKSAIARSIYGANGYQMVKNTKDEVVLEAVKRLKEDVK
jgi:carboxyl-terminal processing protease